MYNVHVHVHVLEPLLTHSAFPKLEQVMSECDDVKEWVELGAALHMPQSDLDNIEHSHGDDPARCRRELFKVGSI